MYRTWNPTLRLTLSVYDNTFTKALSYLYSFLREDLVFLAGPIITAALAIDSIQSLRLPFPKLLVKWAATSNVGPNMGLWASALQASVGPMLEAS